MSAVGNALAAIDPGPALKSVGKSVESVVREVGKGAESLGREIGKVGEAAAKNPIGTLANIAAVATQQYWALPLISATSVVANGGSIEQALKAGAISAAAAWAAQGISEGLNDYFATELTSSAGNASLTATNTLADGTIQHVFSDGSTILQSVNGALSTTPATIAPSLASQLPVSVLQSINTALANAGGSAAMTALQGGNLNQILLDAASGGVGSFAGTQTTTQLRDLGLNTRVAQVLGRTAGAAAAGAVEGQDAGEIFNTALVNNIVRTSLAEAGTALKNTEVAKGLTKYLNEAIQPFKDKVEDVKQSFLEQAKKLTEFKADAESQAEVLLGESESVKTQAETFANDVLSPAEQLAQNAFKTASSSFDQYKSVADQFSDLVSKYDAAKAANNIDLANQYADQANALIPRLNEVTDRYNTDFSAYEVARNDFETKNNTYLGYVNKLNQLNDQYTAAFKKVDDQANVVNQAADEFNGSVDEMQSTLNAKSQEVENAYQQASEYSPIAKSTFADLFGETGDLTKAINLSQQVNALPEQNQQMYEFAKGFGMRTEDALQFAPDISKMSVVAMQSFFDSLAENPDPNAALQTANAINSLDKAQQDAFFNARIQGLDADQALSAANIVGGTSKEQQQAYIDSVKSGLGGPLAEIFSAARLFAGPGTRLESPIDKNLAELTTPEGKRAYQLYLNALGPENIDQAFALAKGEDDAILARGTGTQSAGTGGAYLPPSTERSFFDARRYNPATQEWEPIPIEGQETGGMGGGTGTGTLTSTPSATDESGLRLTQRDIDQYRAEGVPEIELQKLVDKYGIYTPGVDLPDEYQFLVDRLFKAPETKKIATSGTGTTTTPGGTGTGAPATPGGTSTPGTTGSTGTTGGTGSGTTPGTGATTTGPTTTGGAGGTTTTPGGAGGTDQSGAGTGGTGGGGTGTGGTGTGGLGLGFGIGGIGGGGFAIPGGYGLLSQDAVGGIKNLTAGLTERMDYNLAGLPSDEDAVNPMFNAPQIIPQMATGGSTNYDPFSVDTKAISGSGLTPSLTRAQINYILTGMPDYLQGKAEGGEVEGHNPQFYSEGGLSSIENRFVKGDGDGTSDSVPALLADGEFVIPADVVSSLGNGSNDAGAGVLDQFLKVIREHKRNADSKKLPPDSKGPLAYLIDAQRRTKA